MGWFEEQIHERSELDQQLFEDSFFRAAGVILGERAAARICDDRILARQAIDEILKYYHRKPPVQPRAARSCEEQLDNALRPYGLMRRSITLSGRWYRDAVGPILAFTKDGGVPTALLPGKLSGYTFFDYAAGKRIRLDRKSAERFAAEAYCFYQPFPRRSLTVRDLLHYLRKCLTTQDLACIFVSGLAAGAVGLLLPRLIWILTGIGAVSGTPSFLAGVAVCMVCAAVSGQLLGAVNKMLVSRLCSKTTLSVQAAMMMRILSLPASFFRQFSAGEVTERASSTGQICEILLGTSVSAGIMLLTALLYLLQIIGIAPALALPCFLILTVTLTGGCVAACVQSRLTGKLLELSARESGMTYSILNGIQKLRLAGAEKRVYARWLDLYVDGAELRYDPPAILRHADTGSIAVRLLSYVLLSFLAVKSGIGQAGFFAFTAAFGMVTGAFAPLSQAMLSLGRLRSLLKNILPFLHEVPETAGQKQPVTRISGGIELNNVYFRYNEEMPYIFENLSLKIRPGEYVALVGRTGCGKSSLMRLLLGFEQPEKGAVYYDGKDLNRLDLRSLRRHIGTVMQDSSLFQGDILSNITVTAPELTAKDAWRACKLAGLAEDIRSMPMGLHTIISDEHGNFSGGQRQRILIARALAPRPRLLLLDEATSALDNRTQRQICDVLDKMKCTRLVIAHRLSTIRHCDRILVLENGHIIEDGSYEELLAKNGAFAALVERQRTDAVLPEEGMA